MKPVENACSTMRLASAIAYMPAAIVEIGWRLRQGLLKRDLPEIHRALLNLREHLKGMRKALTELDASSFIAHYEEVVAMLDALVPDLRIQLPEKEVVMDVFRSMRAYAREHGQKPSDYHVVRYAISSVLFPLLYKLIKEVELSMALEALGQVVKEPYEEEKDEPRAYRWLKDRARG